MRVAMFMFITGCVVTMPGAGSENNLIKKSLHVVREVSFEPEAVKFRKIRVVKGKNWEGKDGFYVCGEVNMKNRMGGYVGYRVFISNGVTASICNTGCPGKSVCDTGCPKNVSVCKKT